MPRISSLQVEIVTADAGTESPVMVVFNNHPMPFPQYRGGTAAGETFEGRFSPNSFAHSVAIEGPAEGQWAIERLSVTYEGAGEPWTVRFGAVTLDAETALDIWQEPPLPTFDV